ncbi:MAG TPA: hypothetical protein PLR71_00270 [Deltaproteobacteria bacterium]|nr:hypothetical protein [Deltaproteobacteria bacterium]HQI79964.1 hypothetical protein [Deltaproteobacteria bacterium]
MRLGRATTVDSLSLRPKGGAFESRRDSFDRDLFCMPGVRTLAALSMTPEDEHSRTYRIRRREHGSETPEKGWIT